MLKDYIKIKTLSLNLKKKPLKILKTGMDLDISLFIPIVKYQGLFYYSIYMACALLCSGQDFS